jgi:hypothetical protein
MFFADIDIIQLSNEQPIATSILYTLIRSNARTIRFTHTRPFDKNGYLWYIATEQLTKQWENPAASKKITATASSVNPTAIYANPDDFACYERQGHFWGDYRVQGPSWVKIDLLNNPRIVPNYYSLHSAGMGGRNALRSWYLQGSNDDEHWDTLKYHAHDESLKNDHETPTSWAIENCTIPYRYFRIMVNSKQQDEYNSVQQNVYLISVGGIELYGTVYLK